MPDNYALVIGVGNYKGIGPLDGPKIDVLRMTTWLLDPEGGNVLPGHLKSLESAEDLSSPQQLQIDSWVADLYAGFAENDNRGGRLYFYFSGHGLGIKWDETAMLLPPWHSFLRSAALSSSKYVDKLVSDGMFEQVFFFLDCCNNRLPGTNGQGPNFGLAGPASIPASKLVFYASEFDAPAFEAALLDPDKPDNNLTRGLFTEVLLQGLGGAAAGRDGKIRVVDLISFIEEELPDFAKEKKKRQIPRPDNNIPLKTLVCNRTFPRDLPISITFQSPMGNVFLEDADAEVVEVIDSNIGTWTKNLLRGKYCIRNAGDEKGLTISVNGIKNDFIYG